MIMIPSWCFLTTTFHLYVWQARHFPLATSKCHNHASHLLEHAGCVGLVERTVWETAELPSVARAGRTPVKVSALLLGSFAWGAPAAVTALLCHLARTCRLHSWGKLGDIKPAVEDPSVAAMGMGRLCRSGLDELAAQLCRCAVQGD